ncbi:TetR/AcrR family transcriptional regulator [Dactylosporangium sp. AC04546]|uniref:TetR/AcrR family transcriptional regulator n=1 Tax=Dactylosporangium sp. AC04546 TaxID=2862460 RepID=UPI001EDDE5AF|nr:TetR/AcrR family transcriptional regulator [Dactylosporangium sp. AC04546]WVK88224.1 TetR/AcrR family transcriptional regulator [Dactylosporangium sp. AC04546]
MSLRERKKQATREALRSAALRLALERGPENVRVDDIAEAAGVSPRTYNNYFSSREEAIVAGVTAERLFAADRPLIDAVVAHYTEPPPEALMLLTSSPALRACYADSTTAIEGPLADAIVARAPDADRLAAEALAAAVGAAAKVAIRHWLQAATEPLPGLVVPAGSLPDLLRAALDPLRPALGAVLT